MWGTGSTRVSFRERGRGGNLHRNPGLPENWRWESSGAAAGGNARLGETCTTAPAPWVYRFRRLYTQSISQTNNARLTENFSSGLLKQ